MTSVLVLLFVSLRILQYQYFKCYLIFILFTHTIVKLFLLISFYFLKLFYFFESELLLSQIKLKFKCTNNTLVLLNMGWCSPYFILFYFYFCSFFSFKQSHYLMLPYYFIKSWIFYWTFVVFKSIIACKWNLSCSVMILKYTFC